MWQLAENFKMAVKIAFNTHCSAAPTAYEIETKFHPQAPCCLEPSKSEANLQHYTAKPEVRNTNGGCKTGNTLISAKRV